jgi:hypothetical protein
MRRYMIMESLKPGKRNDGWGGFLKKDPMLSRRLEYPGGWTGEKENPQSESSRPIRMSKNYRSDPGQ